VPFAIEGALSSPVTQFEVWMNEAVSSGVSEPHAMVLSTIDADGNPDARVLLLKDLDDDGWHFAASAASPKGRQIANRANVCLTFYWPTVGRQVRIKGVAIDLGRAKSAEDFLARSADSRASALVGRQSEVLRDSNELDDEFVKQRHRVAADSKIVDERWTAYAVGARQVEFWQGATDRRHQRLCYTRIDSRWRIEVLAP
jgi:pyridoxamine 5'-phosphate oxidase